MKYYAVRRGNKSGIFSSQKEFKESIEGYQEPEYRIFKSEKDAEDYMARFYRTRRNEMR
ncbi:MAG: RNase H1/viroplasmin domain-containing protein [Lachnospiraceae bacterium]|nr:RNase H1/viroplasmin domain-containing protein [Lachnospiraceae bacterium]